MKKKNILIVGLFISILMGATAFAAFAQNIEISGISKINALWDVKITNMTEGTLIETETVNMEYTEASATFEVDMKSPGGTASYNVEITNSGTINAKLASITGVDIVNGIEPVDVLFTVTGVTVEQELDAGATHNAVVTVEWQTALAMDASKTATITFNYIQNTN